MLRLTVFSRTIDQQTHDCVIRFTGDHTDAAAYATALWASSELMSMLPGIVGHEVSPGAPPSMN